MITARGVRKSRFDSRSITKIDRGMLARNRNKQKEIIVECNPWQHDFLNDNESTLLAAVGGIGSGKTWSLSRWFAMECEYQKGTRTLGLLTANTYRQLHQAVLPQLWEYLDFLGMRYGIDYVYNEMPREGWQYKSRFLKDHNGILTVRQWGQAAIRSMSNYNDARGSEYGYIGMDEARGASKSAFDVLIGRLRCPLARRLQFRLSTSPNGFDWVYKLFDDEGMEDDDDPHKVSTKKLAKRMIKMRTRDNILGLSADYVDMLYQMYDERMAQQELEGLFINIASGLVYHAFDRSKHVLPTIEPCDDTWCISFDFNRSPYSVALIQVVSPANKGEKEIVHVVDEIFADNLDTQSACMEAISRIKGFDKKGRIEIYGDASGRHKDTRNNHNDYDIITRVLKDKYGDRVFRRWPNKNPAIMLRINSVNSMFRNAKGDMRLFISPRCKNLRNDLEQVSFTPGTKQIDKVSDNKRLTHISDALGYFIAERFPLSPPAVRMIQT